MANFCARRAARAARGCGVGSTPRGSVSIAATSPISAPRSSWVLDSGASFHVTSDQSQLVARKQMVHPAISLIRVLFVLLIFLCLMSLLYFSYP